MSRRGALAGASGALAAVFALGGCASTPTTDGLLESALQPYESTQQGDAIPQSESRQSGEPAREADLGGSGLRRRIGDPANLVVEGERLNAGLLERFYARHGYELVWQGRAGQADALIDAVMRARDHGLASERFHGGLLQRRAALSAPDLDLVLSSAFLSYADALARGAVPVERRKDDEVLAPEPIDVAAVLDRAMARSDPAAVIEALAPATPTYRALREALRQAGSGGDMLGGMAPSGRVRAIEVNLERQRWLPRPLPADRVWVNVADERLVMYRGDAPTFTTRVVVGEDLEHNQSPEFRATIDASFYNPPWVVPADIASAEIIPLLARDPDYLTRNNMVLLASGEVEQHPGPDAGLGLIMFDMPNKFDVYLHDTPDQSVFVRENRRISHGCIRVQRPRELAALLMDQAVDAIDQGIAAGGTTRNELPKPVPVFVVYQTAFLEADGSLQFRPDFYKRDDAIWRQMQGGTVEVAPAPARELPRSRPLPDQRQQGRAERHRNVEPARHLNHRT